MSEKACMNCRQIFPSGRGTGSICPDCKARALSENWSGLIILIDPSGSEIAKMAGLEKPGRYAVKVSR